MKKVINKIICIMCIAIVSLVAFCFVACDAPSDSDVTVTANQATLELDQSAVAGYDYTSLFTVKSGDKTVTVTTAMIDSTAVKAEAGTYTVKCTYENKSATVAVTVKAGGGSSDTDWGDWADVHNAKATIKTHAAGTATYRFQAECTDLRGKGKTPGYSGTASTYTDMAVPFDGGTCISFLYAANVTINFLVVSDRDVDNAELSFRLGAEWMVVPVTPDVFTVRVDRKVSDDDLYAVDNADVEHQGAIGAWDDWFLGYYKNPADTDRVMIEQFECPANAQIDGEDNTSPGSFETFKITSHLSLKKGVNCVSLIIMGAKLSKPLGTMECIAPCVDYMEIKTEAQLGFFGQFDNGYGTNGLSIVA